MKTKRHLEWKIHQHFTVMFIDFDANYDNDYELRGERMASGCSHIINNLQLTSAHSHCDCQGNISEQSR